MKYVAYRLVAIFNISNAVNQWKLENDPVQFLMPADICFATSLMNLN